MRIRRQDYTLLAQAIAIVLPVVALSGVALHFLQEDRAAIDREVHRVLSLPPHGSVRIQHQALRAAKP